MNSGSNYEEVKTDSNEKQETDQRILSTNEEEKQQQPNFKRKMSSEFLKQRAKTRMVMFQKLFPGTRNYEEEKKKIQTMLDHKNQENNSEPPKPKSEYRLSALCKNDNFGSNESSCH